MRNRRPLRVEQLEDRATPSVTLVTVNDASTATGDRTSSNGFSVLPQTSSDGRFVAFSSSAHDLVSPPLSDVNQLYPQDYVRDLQTGTTVWVAPGKEITDFPSISADGRYVAFASNQAYSGTGATANGGTGYMYEYDTQAQTLTLVSNATGANHPVVSPDGRYVAFQSQVYQPGTPTTTPPTNRYQVYLWDRVNDTYTMVSTNAAGTAEANAGAHLGEYSMTFSDDSKVLFYLHNASDLVAGVTDTNNATDVFAYTIATAANSVVSVNGTGTATANAASALRNASADGSRVVFETGATDIDPTAPAAASGNNVFVRDRAAGTTTLVSIKPDRSASGGGQGNLSADGRYVVFQGLGLLPGQANASAVYRYTVASGALEAVNVKPNGTPSGGGAAVAGNQSITARSISADGRFVVFTADGTDLVPGLTLPAGAQLFVRDMVGGVTSLLTPAAGTTLTGSNGAADGPFLTPDGAKVAFYSFATDLAPVTDSNGAGGDVFVADVPQPQPPGAFSFAGATATVAENGGSLVVTVTRAGGSYGLIHVPFATADGTAHAGTDYTAAAGTLTFLNGQTSATITVPITNDAVVNGNRTFTLTLGTPTQIGSLGADPAVTVTIQDDEAPPPPPPSIPLSREVAVGGATDGTVKLFTPDASGNLHPAGSISPFPGFAGVVRSATADVDHDGVPDTVVVTGPGGPIRLAVVSGADNATLLVPPFDPFGGDFTGGGYVSAADLDGDGRAEFVVTPDQGGGPRVSVFSLNPDDTVATRANFLGIDDPNFRGGARAALGDVNHDGVPDVVVAAGFGGGPRTAIFTGQSVLAGSPTRLVGDFFAFPGSDAQNLRNGSFVAAGDVDGDGSADLIFGGGPGGAPRVFILSGALIAAGDPTAAYAAPLANFFVAGNLADRGGARVSVTNADGDGEADVAVGSGTGSPAHVRVYSGKDFTGGGEPASHQDLDPLGGAVLADGLYVG